MKIAKTSYLVFPLFFCLLLLSSVNAQTQTIQKTINLQPKEQITIELDEYYSFTAENFTVVANKNVIQTIQPCVYESEVISNEIKISSLTVFEENYQSKYFIGFTYAYQSKKKKTLTIYFYHLFLDNNSGSLKRWILASKIFQSSFEQASEAILYSNFSGYIRLDNKLHHFKFDSVSSELSFKEIEEIGQLGTSTSIIAQEQDQYKYVLSAIQQNDYVSVILNEINSDEIQNRISTLNIQIKNVVNIISLETIIFLYDKKTRTLSVISINPNSKTIILNKTELPFKPISYNLFDYQRMSDYYIFTFQNEDQEAQPGGWFAKIKFYPNVNGGALALVDFAQTQCDFSKQSTPITLKFINENTFIFEYDYNLYIWSYQKMQILFKTSIEYKTVFDPLLFIGNKFFLLKPIQDQKGSYYQSQVLSIQRSSITIKAQDQSPILVQIMQDQSEFTLNLEILINLTMKPIIIFNQPSISSWNYITDVTDSYFSFSAEEYIVGSNLKPSLSVNQVTSSPTIKNLVFNQILPLKTTFEYDTSQYQQVYQTDGYLSSIFTSKTSNNKYFLTATLSPKITPNFNFELQLISSAQTFNSNIGKMDNFGSFILSSDLNSESKVIYVPFLLDTQLFFQQTQSQTCKNANFAFASNPENGYLFIMCGEQITQYKYGSIDQPSSELYIISKKILDRNTNGYSELICISNILFISNSTSIIAYNYISNSFMGGSITIPILEAGKQQLVYLFHSTFIIVVKDNLISNIAQYSYNNFLENQSPTFLRNLFIDNQYAINTNINFIPKRGMIEYLFVGTTTQDQYILYRINNFNSQNQFYTTTLIKSDRSHIPLISSDSICVLSSNSVCSKIFQKASISYQMNINESLFNSHLVFPSSFKLQISNQSQDYDIQIVRNAEKEHGKINQQDSYLQDIRTQLQDNYFTNGTVFYFKDNEVYNACIFGWQTLQPFYSIINRMELKKIEKQEDQNFYLILYTLQVINKENSLQFENLLTVEGDFKNCIILDDQDSLITDTASSSLTINIYGVCFTKLIKMKMTFTYDNRNNYTKATLNSKKIYDLSSIILGNLHLSRLITIEDSIWAFEPKEKTQYNFQFDEQQPSKSVTLIQSSLDYFQFISYHVINSINNQKLKLYFFENGEVNVINSTIDNNLVNSTVNIKNLLKIVKYNVESMDYIKMIYQFADNQFRIQFARSFVYEVQFTLVNNQLSISHAKLFYYQDAFTQLVGGITGSKYTLLFGTKSEGYEFSIALYELDQNYPEQQYIVRSVMTIPQFSESKYDNVYIVTNTKEISENEFTIYFFNGLYVNLSISDKVGILMGSNKSDFQNETITIYPQLLSNYKYWVRFFVQEQSPINPSDSTSSFKIVFSFLLLIFNNLLIVT